jgi:POT family proton-dependent oligopeptide transporter
MTLLNPQPRGFSIFFLTEMWERYGFYIVQTLLIFYLLKHLHMNDKEAYVIVGSFTALAYINSIFGGLIADNFIGMERALICGGVLLFIGNSILGISDNNLGLKIGLAVITVGTGLVKPNVSSLLGTIYNKDEVERKEAGYTIYYVGIYIGVLCGSLFGGYIQKNYGWHTVFYSAALGGIFVVLISLYGKFKYNHIDMRNQNIGFKHYIYALFYIMVLLLVSFFALKFELFSSFYYIGIALACLAFIFYCIATHKGEQRNKFIAFLLLILMAIVYWSIFFQQFFSLSLAASRTIITSIPYSSLPTVEALGVIFFGPLINYLWAYFQKRNAVSIPMRFSMGFLFNAISFLTLALGMFYAHQTSHYLGVWVILVAYLLIAIGELCLSPTSLFMVTSLIPEKFWGAMMGISLLSIGFGGGKLASLLASFSASDKADLSVLDSERLYMHAFFNYFLICVIAFVVSLILSKYIQKLIKKN